MSIDRFDPIFLLFGLILVFLFGNATLVRIVRRNLATHDYLRALGRIRGYFTEKHPEIEKGLFYLPYDDQPKRQKTLRDILSLGTGGLVEMVALVNSLILAALCTLYARCHPWWMVVSVGVIGFAGAWIYQFLYVMYTYDKKKPKNEEIKFPTPKRD